MKPKKVFAAIATKSRFQLWQPHGVKNTFDCKCCIRVLTPLFMPTMLAPLLLLFLLELHYTNILLLSHLQQKIQLSFLLLYPFTLQILEILMSM